MLARLCLPERWARLRPMVLLGLGIVSVVALPRLAHSMTMPVHDSDIAMALRAHVVWSRLVGVGMMLAGAVSFARLHRREPRLASRQAAVALVALATLSVAAALPFYDAWMKDQLASRYARQDLGWELEDSEWVRSPEEMVFRYELREDNHSGPVVIAFPQLDKGDRYHAFASFRAGDPEAYWKSSMQPTPGVACRQFESQQPAGRPTDPGPQPMHSSIFSECRVDSDGAPTVTAQWGDDAPVGTYVGVILRPGYSTIVAARADESVALVAGAGAIFLFAALAHATGRHGSPHAILPLAIGYLLVAGAWAAGALAPRSTWPAPSLPPLIAFVFLCAIAAAIVVGALVAHARSAVSARDALRWCAFTTGGLALVVPMVAARVWRHDIILAVSGMVVTILLVALGLAATRRLAAVVPAPAAD